MRATVKAKVATGGRVMDASLAGKWISPMHPEIVKDAPGQCDVCGMDLVPVTETDNAPVYVCPMPQCKTATKEPGTCPVCNMNLVEYQPEAASDR